MQRDYQSPELARTSRSADPFRAARQEAPASGSGRAADRRDRSARRRIPTNTSASASPAIGPTEPASSKDHGRRSAARSAAVRRGSVGFGRHGGRQHRRAGAHGRRAGQAVQRFDQDHFALARAGPGEPAAGVRRPQARGLSAQQRRPLREDESRARGSRCAVQPTDGRAAPRDHRSGPPPGDRRRRPIGDFAPSGQAGRAAAWRRSARRSGSSTSSIRSWRFSRT